MKKPSHAERGLGETTIKTEALHTARTSSLQPPSLTAAHVDHGRHEHRERIAQANAVIALLAELFSRCFAVHEARRRPLKVGIRDDLAAALNGAVTAAELGFALRWYTGNEGYLRAMKSGAARLDLNGEPVGAVSAEEAGHALAQLAARRRTPAPPPSAPAPQRLSLSDLRAAAVRRKQASAP